ncbi:MAG: hypothetical protein ACE5HT_06305 [Gemmatimonadales bacterium]
MEATEHRVWDLPTESTDHTPPRCVASENNASPASAKRSRLGLTILTATLVATPASGQVDLEVPGPVSGHPVTAEAITPADVLARVELLRDELEMIRFEMGEPRARPADLDVSDASPRDVMFQAFTLYLKAKQLRFELTGAQEQEVLLDQPREVRPFHTWKVVELAYSRTLRVKQTLGIQKRARERVQDSTTTPTDVFRAISAANLQFDLLLKQQLSAADVFRQVTQARHYAARLLGQFPGAEVRPRPRAFEHGRRPVDVYNRLVDCYVHLRNIARNSGIETLNLRVSKLDARVDDPLQVAPSAVYNLAVLLVSELAYLHQALNFKDVPVPSLDLGFKLPADVYWQAGNLLDQLTDLDAHVDANRTWLNNLQIR